MKRATVAVLLGAVALAGCASSGRKPHASAGVRAEVGAAQASDGELFAIFPRLPGEKRCTIPVIEGLRESKVAGICRTRVWYPSAHGHGEVRVVFRESWGKGRVSSWTLREELPTTRVLVTKLHGEPAPQLRYAATDKLRAVFDLRTRVWTENFQNCPERPKPSSSCDSGCTPANQPALDAAASYAEKVAGDAANKVHVYLAHAPQSVLDELRARHPGICDIHDDAPRTLRDVVAVEKSIDWKTWKARGIIRVFKGSIAVAA